MAGSSCPRCGSEVVPRTNSVSGQKFLGCSRFPRCRGSLNSDGSVPGARRRFPTETDGKAPSLSELAQDWGWDSWEDFSDSIE